ncbi:ADP-ribosylglycohydrolase family protein [Pricia sp.]|uniref:ADP-ribosylglycohydrolase family protein n=1 Tax=Pricia sp. TaxID=2268138 RepID=UPI003593A349
MKNKLSYRNYYNKVLGGWIGKCAGGILGAPIEGFKRFNDIPYSDALFATNFANDDLDLQVLWLDMLLKKGKTVRESDFKQHWLKHVEFPWCEYGIATKNMRLGLDNPDTGRHNNGYWNTGMGSPIRSEIWGMVNPGLPEKAAFYAGMDSQLDHDGFSVTAEQYLAACEAIAFLENDVKKVLKKGLDHIPSDSDCAKMVEQIFEWDDKYDFDIVAGKIKSRYGDADFTAAPMNVAFIIVSLLHANNSFDFMMDALHLGHDSDCVVATAGALLGIVLGYDAIPEVWKQRVGNELLVSPEISGIHCPKTITELSELTCKAGIHFTESEQAIEIGNYPSELRFSSPEKRYELYTEVTDFPNPVSKKDGKLKLNYENLSSEPQNIRLEVSSPYFKNVKVEDMVSAPSRYKRGISLELTNVPFPKNHTKIPYSIKVSINGDLSDTLEKGIPYYGNWLLLGPFIEDDYSLVPLNKKYPDHGLSSLPSIQYMNHDKARSNTQFLDTDNIERWLADKSIFDQAFQATIIHPLSMKMELGQHFLGLGERSLYLYSEIEATESTKKWLCLGSTAFLKIWFNDIKVYSNHELIRAWPMAHAVELELKKGTNKIMIRMDVTLDDFGIEIGLKEHGEKHYHQSRWETDLQFTMMDRL